MEEFPRGRVEQRHVRELQLGRFVGCSLAEKCRLETEAAGAFPLGRLGVEVPGEIPPLEFEFGMRAVVAGKRKHFSRLRHGEALGGGERDLRGERSEQDER